jgi:aminoglycoside phosphotransferase (APT) family kinase protein
VTDNDVYRWGYTHGSFTPDNVLINLTEDSDIAFDDFSKVGYYGSPGVDLGNFIYQFGNDFRDKYEADLIEAYYGQLIRSGVSNAEYSLN